jgi:hypothetical protein
MERRRGAIKTDIGDEFAAFGYFIKSRRIGTLVQKAPLGEDGQKIGFWMKAAGHGTPLHSCAKLSIRFVQS